MVFLKNIMGLMKSLGGQQKHPFVIIAIVAKDENNIGLIRYELYFYLNYNQKV